MGNTKVDLVKDLENELEYSVLITDEEKKKIPGIIANAKRGMYHDFESEFPAPKMQLHIDLLNAGLENIDKKMQNGDYDDEPPTKEQKDELLEKLK